MARSKKHAKGPPAGPARALPRASPRNAAQGQGRLQQHQRGQQQGARRQFSMQEEARFTASHTHAFDPDRKLRYLKVNFVSAGMLEGTVKDKEQTEEMEEKAQIHRPSSPAAVSSSPEATGISHLAITTRSPSPSPSDSSMEEVVFKGRRRPPAGGTQGSSEPAVKTLDSPVVEESAQVEQAIMTPESHVNKTSMQAEPAVINPETGITEGPAQKKPVAPVVHEAQAPLGDSEARPQDTESEAESIVQDTFKKRLGGKTKWETNTTPWESRSKPGIGWLPSYERPDMGAFLRGEVNPPATSATEDYLQNVQEFGYPLDASGPASSFARRDLNLDDDGWDEDMLQDLDGMDTSDEAMGPVKRIISRRERGDGVQYLVVYEGSTVDNADWLRPSSLATPNDLRLIKAFEMDVLSRIVYSSDSDESDTGDNDDEDEDDQFEDDMVLTDEQLAPMLAKQEELGLGSNDMLLFGPDSYFGAASPIDRPWKRRQQRAKGSISRSKTSFPSASALADVLESDPYNGFDIMDTDRPSLKPKKKGRRGQIPPELSDPELNEQMQATWEADRSKKRLKKAEREELRKQGLLGRKGKGPDLGVKYKDGFTMPELLRIAPMDAGQRAVVHQFAGKLNLTSKSRGTGEDRFTVLSKSTRTKVLNDDEFDTLVEQKSYKYRLQGSLRGTFKSKGDRVRPSVGYKDGDLVGASAPELGPENKGRALLEKMGWKKGTALGALDNKGILQPIAHMVKMSKAGLK
ncbi:hypothetical protein BCR34DRAFT_558084 [Clohesyomyces aquaticus]|uniref:Protein SQS1 n=1 Tax=Clohesyomyces aquaticus TaxID=1231657 RepID=A0A1Y1ZZW6_9PLEO|nr:hypothetical protein BCR34DRAFT_558084 [Clohesyomyces aquaticus]